MRKIKKLDNDDEKVISMTQKQPKVKPEKIIPKPKWKLVLKIGKWNPNTKIIE